MARVKPDTRRKDQLQKQEIDKNSNRTRLTKSLNQLLVSLPKVDQNLADQAQKTLVYVADQYRASKPLADELGRRSKTSLAEARAAVAAINKHLSKANELFLNLPQDALAALGDAASAPIGKLRTQIENIQKVAQTAQAHLAARPDKVPDEDRNILAYQVAVVFRDILKIAPSSTKASQLKEFKYRGGAAYDRVMRATFSIAGVTNYDAGPLITAGLRLLKDPNLPRST